MQVASSFHFQMSWLNTNLPVKEKLQHEYFWSAKHASMGCELNFCRVMNYTQGVSLILIAHIPTQATYVQMCMYKQYKQTNKKIMWKWEISA
jgi:hypothetical protein